MFVHSKPWGWCGAFYIVGRGFISRRGDGARCWLGGRLGLFVHPQPRGWCGAFVYGRSKPLPYGGWGTSQMKRPQNKRRNTSTDVRSLPCERKTIANRVTAFRHIDEAAKSRRLPREVFGHRKPGKFLGRRLSPWKLFWCRLFSRKKRHWDDI